MMDHFRSGKPAVCCYIGNATFLLRSARVVAAALILLAAGCSASNPLLSSGPSPRVEDCMLLQQSTPTKFVCGTDAKTYTSVQLADIRKGGKTDSR